MNQPAAPSRSILKLTLSLGLLWIPVKQYSAVEPAMTFNTMTPRGQRVKQRLAVDNEPLPTESKQDLLKAYEFSPGQYVTFTPDELRELDAPNTKTADIQHFVPLDSIDPIYYERTYYLGPDKGAQRPYSLLVAALQHAKRAAVATWNARGRSHICALRAQGDLLVMHTLHFRGAIRQAIAAPKPQIKPAELKLAMQLIAESTGKFDASAYQDERQARVRAAIDVKVAAGKVIVTGERPAARGEKPEPGKGAQVIDLMAALRASLKPAAPKRRKRA